LSYGPKTRIAQETHADKYRQEGESFETAMNRIASHLMDNEEHYYAFRDILLNQRFLPAGRVQASCGAARQVTPYNCFVSQVIPDSMEGIMEAAKRAAITMRYGGGIGYDFSTLRPRGDHIKSLDANSSGPVSFMDIFNSVCGTVASAGNRRGAQMGVLRVDHPDIEEFIRLKQDLSKMRNFNLSVGVTDEFMQAVHYDSPFTLRWGGNEYKTVSATALWAEIMRSTWDYAEPGVLFLDTMNRQNNLNYCETLSATNPCAEQPLPPNGACLLGSFNLTKYLEKTDDNYHFNITQFKEDIKWTVRSMDNIIDRAIYPLPEQEEEAKSKRRMGLGVTGVANTIEAMGNPYGSGKFKTVLEKILSTLANTAYTTSALLAKEKGHFPLYNAVKFNNRFISKLTQDTIEHINQYGLRNSHLLSIAPTGTISITADNISSGIEPVYSYGSERTIITKSGTVTEVMEDYGVKFLGVRGKQTKDCTVDDHLSVLILASKWVDSAVSKTCNVGDNVSFTEFSDLYMRAWLHGAKGCTTFRESGKRIGILKAKVEEEPEFIEGTACYIDPETGVKTCE
jgi:ribonucleoside-diphosphate reductase alpha chain